MNRIRRMTIVTVLAALMLPLGSIGFSQDVEAQPTPTKVACLGDSITRGPYPTLLGTLLGDGFTVGNFAQGGIPLSTYCTTKSWAKARQFKADIVVVLLGTNDAHEKNWKSKAFYKEKMKELVDGCREVNPKVEIYLCVPPPILRSKWGHDGKLLADEIVPAVKEVGKAEGCKLIDLYAVFLGKEELSKDGVHPNAVGYELMAKTIANALKPEHTSGKPATTEEVVENQP